MRDLVFVIPLVLISPPVMQGLELRQPAMLVAALISAAAILADRGRFALSGIALALATIKPQMCILPIAWMLLWALHGWATRKNLVSGFGATMLFLVGAGEVLLPGWISDFLAQLRVYRQFAGASMLELLYGRGVGLVLTAVFVSLPSRSDVEKKGGSELYANPCPGTRDRGRRRARTKISFEPRPAHPGNLYPADRIPRGRTDAAPRSGESVA